MSIFFRTSDTQACNRLRSAALAVFVLLLSACGPTRMVATVNLPRPLIVKIPVAVALHMPQEFAAYVHKEKRWGTSWEIDLGKAQSDGLNRLLDEMFDQVVRVDNVEGADTRGVAVRAILQPALEEYSFITPRDAGSQVYAVSVKYRVNVYTPEGRLADSWSFTGYGSAPTGGFDARDPMQRATALALRDAGAKLVTEFREQAIVRGLIPENAPMVPMSAPGTAAEAPAPATAGEASAPGVQEPAPEQPAEAPVQPQQTEEMPPAPADAE